MSLCRVISPTAALATLSLYTTYQEAGSTSILHAIMRCRWSPAGEPNRRVQQLDVVRSADV